MKTRRLWAWIIVAAALGATSVDAAAGSGFPGDNGRPNDGLPMTMANMPPPPPKATDRAVAAVPVALAIDIARAAEAACAGFKVGVSIIDADGAPKLYYVGDAAEGGHAYTGFRKAYTALTFKAQTSKVGELAKSDPQVIARIKADPNLISWAGGVPIVSHGVILGAVGVSGAEPSEKDEACAVAALKSVEDRLP